VKLESGEAVLLPTPEDLLGFICRSRRTPLEEVLKAFCRETGASPEEARRMLRALEKSGKVRIVYSSDLNFYAEPLECAA